MRASSSRVGQRLVSRQFLNPKPMRFPSPFAISTPLNSRSLLSSLLIKNQKTLFRIPVRNASSTTSQPTSPSPSSEPTTTTSLSNPLGEPPTEPSNQPPSYQLTFTCKPCMHRSSHRVTKQGFHHGTVIITCPSCHARHVIADHLKICMNEASSLEDILKRKASEEGGEADLQRLLKKGRLGIRQGELVGREGEEDIEFWEDGSETVHPVQNEGEKV